MLFMQKHPIGASPWGILMYLQCQQECGKPIGDAAVACIVGMESVGAQQLFLHLQPGLDSGGSEQIQHRQGIEPSHLFDDIHVIHQAAAVMIESILRFTVDRRDEHDGRRGIFLDQAAHQGSYEKNDKERW